MKQQPIDYEPVRRSHSWSEKPAIWSENLGSIGGAAEKPGSLVSQTQVASLNSSRERNWILRRGHFLSYVGLFLFTATVYFRPYELIPALSGATTMAYWLAVFTLVVFVPTQLGMEGTLTARPREVNLVLLLGLCALLSIPFGDDIDRSWNAFADFSKVILMFIVMVNVVRTERRLQGMFFLVLAVSVYLSVNAFSDYHAGILKSDGYRVVGTISNMFSNPNDLALHLVTIAPIALALLLSTRNVFMKIAYAVCAFLMVGAVTLTYSRGGFLGLSSAAAYLAWRLGRRKRFLTYGATVLALTLFIAFAPGGYGKRVSEITGNDGSAMARTGDLKHSLLVMLRHPLFGVGMTNYVLRSDTNTATHNAYTQVGADLGIMALVFYLMFMVTPFKRLRQIESETLETRRREARFYYLAVGLQASLIGYMVSSFFASVCYLWNVYYLVGYAVCLHRMYLAQQSVVTVDAVARSKAGRNGVRLDSLPVATTLPFTNART